MKLVFTLLPLSTRVFSIVYTDALMGISGVFFVFIALPIVDGYSIFFVFIALPIVDCYSNFLFLKKKWNNNQL
jgi:hypothetical protein